MGLEFEDETRKLRQEAIQNAISKKELASLEAMELNALRALDAGDEIPGGFNPQDKPHLPMFLPSLARLLAALYPIWDCLARLYRRRRLPCRLPQPHLLSNNRLRANISAFLLNYCEVFTA